MIELTAQGTILVVEVGIVGDYDTRLKWTVTAGGEVSDDMVIESDKWVLGFEARSRRRELVVPRCSTPES